MNKKNRRKIEAHEYQFIERSFNPNFQFFSILQDMFPDRSIKQIVNLKTEDETKKFMIAHYLIRTKGYLLEELKEMSDQFGNIIQFNFDTSKLLKLKYLEQVKNRLPEQVESTIANRGSGQPKYLERMNNENIKKDPIHWEITNIFRNNSQLKNYCY